jgi:L-rhamnose isomerase/sugar isomerase
MMRPVAVPTWGVGTGGTRFARFPGTGRAAQYPRQAGGLRRHQPADARRRASRRIFPGTRWATTTRCARKRRSLGLGFDAVNSNTFQDQPGPARTATSGSLTHADAGARAQAVEHNIECIEIGRQLGSTALTVWIGDGTNFPGQQDFARSLRPLLDARSDIYAALPEDWRCSRTQDVRAGVLFDGDQDWGRTSWPRRNWAQGQVPGRPRPPRAQREHRADRGAAASSFGKLGGFHFNDSKYGDDDLDSGSIDPHRLFLVFNELVEAELRRPRASIPPT